MAEILRGAPVADALTAAYAEQAQQLREKGVAPTLAIVRVGEKPDDIAYENSAAKRCEKAGVAVRKITLPQAVGRGEMLAQMQALNTDAAMHGVLLLRPLPKTLDEEEICNALAPQKDIDGITDASLAGVFTGHGQPFAPCTAQACMELLDHYGIDPKGKRVVVVGRSLVVGKPLAMLLLGRHATVTICHTRTQGLAAVCREAEILVAAAGQMEMIGQEYLAPGQVVLDVGIHVDDEGKLRGDVDFESAQAVVGAITPVPGGVGTVTSTVLAGNVVKAAARAQG
ncbi:bifunctional 5,10-methylenetetrahydrofolate dehydrogenase/5,10-methenyltetrahydrofolate cyclohydrolase [Ruminococcaceae bacterium OttesenSCG-928-O06]|nr:bifunctional 5,10-methylenetetrahydrofolate dehydrogenase/5,10-methenyltetrahydrofolate cyclohydrolase [Ruminococcaceae bacterium OttesenSCG-928-O06]